MGTKQKPGRYDCHRQALPDEPLFTLLARDRDAPELVRAWAAKRAHAIKVGLAPPEDGAKIAEARALADQMEAWRRANSGRWGTGSAPEPPKAA